jgi:hypothetical protein
MERVRGEEQNMQTSATGSLIERIPRAAWSRPATYRAIAEDASAGTQALIVVGLAALAGGIGSLDSDHPERAFVGAVAGMLIGWSVFAAVAYAVGVRLFRAWPIEVDRMQVLRVLGFALTPYLLMVFGLVPGAGYWFCFVVAPGLTIWATYTALKATIEIEEGRARAAAILAVFALLIVMSITGVAIGASVYGEGSV